MRQKRIHSRMLAATKSLLATLVRSASEKDLLQASVEALMELLQVRYGAISMLDEQGQLCQFVYSGLTADEADAISKLPVGGAFPATVNRKHRGFAVGRRAAGSSSHHQPMTSLLAVPVSCGDRTYGRIYLCDRLNGEPFSDEDEELASIFARALTQVLDTERKLNELKREHRSLIHFAFHDPLTNLPNRNLLCDRIGKVLSQAQRNRTHAAIMFCDLDDFKGINDSLGHHAGDQVLKTVSERLAGWVRAGDTVARIGGDEFVFVFSNIESAEYVRTVAQKILGVMSRSVEVEGCELVLSGSVGIAVYPFDGETTERLLRNADAAMYKAKELGKNTYSFYCDDSVNAVNREDIAPAPEEQGLLHQVR